MELSLEEKIKIVSGSGMWQTSDLGGKISSITFSDGPHGIRKEIEGSSYLEAEKATCFPTASCVSASWDLDLISQMARGIAIEAINKGVSIVLGPGINMKRTPLCGRNFEYYSEDPYLSGKLASSYINSMESMGVGTSLKHFAVNNQESNRQMANAQVDERALREIYLRAFEIAIKDSKPATVMTSYNRVNGEYSSENKYLLTDILRNEWGYEGTVISDWGACVNLPRCIEAGLDLEMPDSLGIHGKALSKSIKKGLTDQNHLDRASNNVLKLVSKYSKQLEHIDESQNHELARKIANESAILLKNNGILPLNITEDKEIIIIGKLAEDMRFQGGGSSLINSKYHKNAIKAFEEKGYLVKYAEGYRIDSEEMDNSLINEAMDIVKTKGKILFFGGLTELIEGEGFDRTDIHMPRNQEHLLKMILKERQDVIYVSFSGAPYRVDFLDNLAAFLQMYLAGEAVGEAIVDIVSGVVNPSGKLAETWPKELEDVLSTDYFDRNSKDLQYRESLFVGYRYFDTYSIETRFEFGKGLSYTEFEYSNLDLSEFNYESGKYTVSFEIKNIGNVKGKEIAQVYVKNPREYFLRENKGLRGFEKIELEAGESKKVTINLDDRSFSLYDTRSKRYIDHKGKYEVQIGASINDIRLREQISIEGEYYHRVDRSTLAQFFVKSKPVLFEDTFEFLYDKKLSNFDKMWIGDYSLYNSLNDLAKVSLFAKLIRFIVSKQVKKRYSNLGRDNTQLKMMAEGAVSGPFDAVISQSGMPFLHRIGLMMVNLCNKRKIRAIWSLISGKL